MPKLHCKTEGCDFTAESTRSLSKHKCKKRLDNAASTLAKRKTTLERLERKRLRREDGGGYSDEYEVCNTGVCGSN